MSELIERLQRELDVDRDTAIRGAGAIFSVIKERVGLRTFQMLKVPFPEADAWIDHFGGMEGYGAGDYFLKDTALSGPVVDVIERATAAGVDLETAQRMFVVILDAIKREAVDPVARKVAEYVPSPSALATPVKKRMRRRA
jgi:hypothetical protein